MFKRRPLYLAPSSCETCHSCVNHCRRAEPIPLEDAFEALWEKVRLEPSTETVALTDALGRVSATEVHSQQMVPNTNCASKDCVAVRWDDLVARYEAHGLPFWCEDFSIAPMGGTVEDRYDTLLHAEQCQLRPDGRLRVLAMPQQYQCLMWSGTSLQLEERIVACDAHLGPGHLSMLRMGGIEHVEVKSRPRARIIPTGDDLVAPGEPVGPGQRIESNGIYIQALLETLGARCSIGAIEAGRAEDIARALADAVADHDLVVVVGGIGKGRTSYGDHALDAIEMLGEVITHGVLVSPGGAPTVVAHINGTAVIGIPGPAHAALVMADQVLTPIIARYYRNPCVVRSFLHAELAAEFCPRSQSVWYTRVHVRRRGDAYLVYPPVEPGDTVDNFIDCNGELRVLPGGEYPVGAAVAVRLLCDVSTVPQDV